MHAIQHAMLQCVAMLLHAMLQHVVVLLPVMLHALCKICAPYPDSLRLYFHNC